MSEDRRRRDRDVVIEANNVFIDADKVIIRAGDIVVQKDEKGRRDDVRDSDDRRRRNFW